MHDVAGRWDMNLMSGKELSRLRLTLVAQQRRKLLRVWDKCGACIVSHSALLGIAPADAYATLWAPMTPSNLP